MRRLAIFTIIGILALAGCSGSGCLTDGSGGSSPAVSPTSESRDGGGTIDKSQKLLNPWDFPKDSDEKSPLAEPGKTKDGTKTRESRTPKAGTGPTPVTITGPGICGRTPEIQEKLIEMLQIRSCQVINAAELYRVREFSASAQSFKVGDFDDLPNLLKLSIHIGQEKANTLDPGIFQDLHSLNSLKINGHDQHTIRLNKDTFKGLNNLIVLDISYIEHLPDGELDHLQQLKQLNILNIEHLPEGALDHLQQLKQLNIFNIKGDIPSKLLDQLQNVESIGIYADSDENSTPRTLPTDFLKNLPKLRGVGISSKYLPDSMEVNSYEIACQIENWSNLRDKEGNIISMTVDSKIVKLTERTIDHDPINERDVQICQFNVGDTETKKIIIPLE